MAEKAEKSLLGLFLKMNVSYTDISNEILLGGHTLHRGTLEKYVRGTDVHIPSAKTVDAMEFGFIKAAEKWRPQMVDEITAWFEAYRGDGDE